MNTTDRLRSHLNQQNDAILPTGHGPEAAMAAGLRIRRSRHAAMFSVAFVAVALVGLAGFSLRFESGSTDTDLAEPPAIVAPVTPSAVSTVDLVANDFDWEVFDATIPDLQDAFAWDGSFYALSTAPGRTNPAEPEKQAIYSSTDGDSWAMEIVDDYLWISDIDHYDGTLYAIGTAPGVLDNWRERVEAQAAFTTDGGATWQTTDLPVVAIAPEDSGEVLWRGLGAQIAAGPKGVIGVVSTRYGLDYWPYVPEEYQSLESGSVHRTVDGIEVVDHTIVDEMVRACDAAARALEEDPVAATTTSLVDGATIQFPAECSELAVESPPSAIVFSQTWVELGVEPPADQYAELFVSADGSNFEAVPSPFTGSEVIELYATGDGFMGVEYAYDGVSRWRIWSSPDGRSWDLLETPFGFDSFVSAGTVGRDLVLVGYQEFRVAPLGESASRELVMLVSRDNARSWETTNLTEVFGLGGTPDAVWVSAIDIGPAGVGLGLFIEPPPGEFASARVLFSEDLSDWSEVPMGDLGVGPLGSHVSDIATGGKTVLMSASVASGSGSPDWLTLVGTRK